MEKIVEQFKGALIAGAVRVGVRMFRHEIIKRGGKNAPLLVAGAGAGMAMFKDNLPKDVSAIASDVANGLIIAGMDEAYLTFMEKAPQAWAVSATEIKVINLDPTTLDSAGVKVRINGTDLASNAYTVSGSKEDFTIKLQTALASGEHEIVVLGHKKAVYTKIKV